MEEFDHEKYEVSLQGEQVVDGQPCYVIAALPLKSGGKSVYEKKILYLRKEYPLSAAGRPLPKG